MRSRPTLLLFILGLIAAIGSKPLWAEPALIPQPDKYQAGDGVFVLDRSVHLGAAPEAATVAQYFADLSAPALGGKLDVVDPSKAQDVKGPAIEFKLDPALAQLGTEGYRLSVTPQSIEIESTAPAGLFYACQTLRQLLPAEFENGKKSDVPLAILCCRIEDHPRYPWRGALLDCSRHFFSKASILRFLDLLAYHKMNVFHWHLTDDQGWRIDIRKYPRLTEIGAWRVGDILDFSATKPSPDQDRYGGFYTQEDIRQIVAYAQSRFINVVPEIEMPGHSIAALAAYPEFGCTAGPFEVGSRRGIYKDVYCPGKEETFTFLENVLDEVCDLFPGQYIHIGGDECPKDRWKTSADCQRVMKENNLKDENALQGYFAKRIADYLQTKHRRTIGWDEILQGDVPADATITCWHDTADERTAAIAGHDVVMCLEPFCYFNRMAQIPDVAYHNAEVPLDRVYSFEPAPPGLTADQARHIIGAQGNIWSEFIRSQDRLDYMEFPRMCALAENLWTPSRGDFPNFASRLLAHFKRLDALGVKYYDDPLAHALLVASWQPGQQLPAKFTPVDYPLALAASGSYEVRFELIDGSGRLDVRSVALLENGAEIDHDAHAGGATTRPADNLYHVTLKSLTPNATYALRISLRAAGTDDMRGDIFLIPASIDAHPDRSPQN